MHSPDILSQPNPATKTQATAPKAPSLSLYNDLVFKTLFSRYPQLLADLINSIRHHAAPVTVERILNPTILPQDLASKEIVLDILVQDADGQRFGVEMQLRRLRHWVQRNVYGIARSLAEQLVVGQDYRHLQPSIGISLLAHNLFTDYPDKADWHFTLRDTHAPTVQLGEALQMHIIELPKAEKLSTLPAPLLAWITCLLHNLDEAAMNEITHPPVREALSHLETMYSDEELRLAAERRELALIDAEDALDQARYEGEQKGEKKGHRKGKLEGKQEYGTGLLQRLLTHQFGPLSQDLQQRIQSGTPEQLETWSLNILDAKTLDDVFRH